VTVCALENYFRFQETGSTNIRRRSTLQTALRWSPINQPSLLYSTDGNLPINWGTEGPRRCHGKGSQPARSSSNAAGEKKTRDD